MDQHEEEDFPSIPERHTSRGQALEASASTIWTLLFFAYSSSTFIAEFGHGWSAAWTIIFVLIPVSLAGTPAILDQHRGAIPMLLSYLIYAIIPSLLQLIKPNDYFSLTSELCDLFTVLLIWLPLELKLLNSNLSPTGKVPVWGLLTAALNILNIFTVLRPFTHVDHARDIGYSFKLSPSDFATSILLAFVSIAAVIPVSMITSFAKFSPRPSTHLRADKEIPAFIGKYMSALTEELLFRGLIQNMIEQRMSPNSPLALLLASLAYALVHIPKSKLGHSSPNYRFALSAFISGTVCGFVWRSTGKVTASAITHALSDSILYRFLLDTSSNRSY